MSELPGPSGPIPYRRDRLGYPTIEARNFAEGTYALGYLHGRDRLLQATFTRLAARGQLMSVLGDVPLARLIDRSSRSLGLCVDLPAQVERIDAESRHLLDTYCAGFNAGAATRGVPLVLRLLGTDVSPCTPEEVLAVFRFVTYFGLTSMQVSSELVIAELCARGASRRALERLLGPYARGLEPERLRGLRIPEEVSFFGSRPLASPLAGSNAFAVSGKHSRSGGALLMGEFHMEVGRFPPLLYAAHLAMPGGEYLSGMTIPGLSWFVAGRTPRVGWSYTFAHADNVDFLVEDVKDEHYRVAGEYRPLRKRVETVQIRRRPSETWTFYENDYGTLLGDARAASERAAVRVSGLSETHRAFSAARKVLECQTVDDLVTVQREVRSVSLEAILVDQGGRIASVVTGQIDRRADDWTGAYPKQRGDMDGIPEPVEESLRPLSIDPECGFLVSANQGGQGEHRARWCSFPEPLYRFERITERLGAKDPHDLSSLLAISYDFFDRNAARLLPIWGPLLPDHPLAEALLTWQSEQKDRKLLSLFYKLHEEVCFGLLEQDLGREAARRFREWSAIVFYQQHLDSVLALEHPELLGPAELRELLDRAFFDALAGYEKHDVPVRLRFKHLLTQGRTPAFLGFDSMTVELPGSPGAPFQCRVSPIAGTDLIYAPAFHLLIDMKESHAYYNLPGGASESRFGPGYGKGVAEWLSGELLPLGHPELPPLQRPVGIS